MHSTSVPTWAACTLASAALAALTPPRLSAQSAPPPNFQLQDVLLGLDQPTALRFLPNGRMLVLLKQGRVLIADPANLPAAFATYMDLREHEGGVEGDQERGLIDVALHPSFPSSPYVYLFYTPANSTARVSRFTHVPNGGGINSFASPSSEVVLWQDTDGYDSCCHYGGGLSFGPDGNLWLTTGDHFQGSFAPDPRHAGGKVIRIRPDGSVPPDNPFFDGPGPNVDSVFCTGLRNPFRSRWDLPTGRLFIAEVGGNDQSIAWEDLHVLRYDSAAMRFVDGDFGTANDDGVFDGIDYGWPTVEGLPPHTDFPDAQIQPIGEPIFGYAHGGEFASITGGVVYRRTRFPPAYQGAYFYGDSSRDLIRYLRFAADGSIAPNPSPPPIDVDDPDPFSYPFDLSTVGQVVCLDVGPDGHLYYVSFNDAGGSGLVPPQPGSVRRYVYDATNLPPVVQLGATPESGLAPLAVRFTVQATDPEHAALSFTLDFADGSPPAAQPLSDGVPVDVFHTFTADGPYECLLTVTDGVQTVTRTRTIRVGNPPVIQQFLSTNSRPGGEPDVFRFGDVITFAAQATDAEDGSLSGKAFTWSVSFIRPGASHPAFGPATGSTSIQFPIPAQGQGFSGPVFYRCFLTVEDESGLTTDGTLDIFPDKVDIHFDSVPQGIAIQVNGNTSLLTPFTLDTLINLDHVVTAPGARCVGGEQYVFASWSNGLTTPQQVYVAPEVESTLTAMYTATGPCAGPPTDGLVLHLDTSSGLVLNGDGVLSWVDRSAFGNDLAAAGNPIRIASVFNGRDAVHFDGLSAALGRTGFAGVPTGSANRSMFLVVRYNDADPSDSGWAGFVYGTPATNAAFGLALSPDGWLGVQAWGAGDVLSDPPTNGVGGLLSHSTVYQSGTLTQYLLGSPIGTTNRTFATGTGGIRLGEELDGGKNLDMDVAEILVYDRAVSEAERVVIESYLEERYRISSGGGNAPTVRILSPENGATLFTSDLPVTLQGEASDFEDGDLSDAIVWSSNVDGPLGTGPSIFATLSEGMHVLVARATDSSFLEGSHQVEVVVTDDGGGLVTSGLVLHLEADADVVVAGNTVTSWLDLSPRANDVFASGDPQRVAGATPSGLPAVHLDGNDELARVHATHPLSGFPAGNADRTVFFVVRYLASTAWAGLSYGAAATNQAFGVVVRHPTGELVLQGYGSGDLVSSAPGIGAGWLVQSAVLDDGVARLFDDGAQVAQWTHAYQTALARLTIGRELGGLGYVTADVAAVLVYDRALNEGERANVESYLAAKYLGANTAPITSILAPEDGAHRPVSEPLVLRAVATDAQQGDVTAGIVWSSDRDGVLGSGGTLGTSALSPGRHTITAAATDLGGLTGSDTIELDLDAVARR